MQSIDQHWPICDSQISMSVQQAHLCAAFDATHDGFENRRESHCAQSGRASDDRESIQRCWGGVRMQAGDSDECTDRAPAMSAADEGCTARHQCQHLRAQYRASFTIGYLPFPFPELSLLLPSKAFLAKRQGASAVKLHVRAAQVPPLVAKSKQDPNSRGLSLFANPVGACPYIGDSTSEEEC